MGVKRGLDGLRDILGEVDFPVDKDAVVQHALDADADTEIVSALRAMPPAEYNEPNEVLRSVPLEGSEEGAQTEAARVRQARERKQSGMAESAMEDRPVNPIEEELGENRKA
ncbi:DUF2795 domain-containing protein [Nocardiopsis kunsanensis]|uniref:DUF2795 domain-containing protein n=1 Tax=Nocardiopsis kunsanensis TaxID=141693 RepID=A0A918XCP5_9ACTN|nr:DUF2795 domain-containing protein [Nocardiopsis kunsanensis]GHD24640.1 hypothetical protein GCM10007147_20940 [Nocardiopsis kunsanensis]